MNATTSKDLAEALEQCPRPLIAVSYCELEAYALQLEKRIRSLTHALFTCEVVISAFVIVVVLRWAGVW